ncbi:MAG: flagellar hook-associated protein FlgK [Acetobacteraceae bacterium]
MSLEVSLTNARSGIALIGRQLTQTAADIANAGTAGYTDKRIEARSLTAKGQPMGVRALPAERLVDAALAARLLSARSADAAAGVREAALARIEQAHGSVAGQQSLADLTARMTEGLLALRDMPSDPIRSRAAVTAAEDLAARFHALSDTITRVRQDAQDGMVAEVAAINATLREIARLTDEIRPELASGRSVADLEDRRDVAIARLAESLDVTVLRGGDGGVTLVTRSGTTLPLDRDRDALSIADATVGASAYYGSGGTLPGVILGGTDVTASLGGGRLGEYRSLRDGTLPRMQAELDVLATGFAARFEAQGLRLFTDGGGAVPDPSAPYATSGAMGFAAVIRVSPAVAADPSLLRDGTHAVPGFTPNPPGGPASFTGLLDRLLTFALGTEESPGVPHPGFASAALGPDGSLLARVVPQGSLAAQATQLVSVQTAERAEAARAAEAAGTLRTGLEARFAQMSGVDVDREMAAMVVLQNAYAANARVISAVQQMFDSLLGAVR